MPVPPVSTFLHTAFHCHPLQPTEQSDGEIEAVNNKLEDYVHSLDNNKSPDHSGQSGDAQQLW